VRKIRTGRYAGPDRSLEKAFKKAETHSSVHRGLLPYLFIENTLSEYLENISDNLRRGLHLSSKKQKKQILQ
jgi:hypothetical protein